MTDFIYALLICILSHWLGWSRGFSEHFETLKDMTKSYETMNREYRKALDEAVEAKNKWDRR